MSLKVAGFKMFLILTPLTLLISRTIGQELQEQMPELWEAVAEIVDKEFHFPSFVLVLENYQSTEKRIRVLANGESLDYNFLGGKAKNHSVEIFTPNRNPHRENFWQVVLLIKNVTSIFAEELVEFGRSKVLLVLEDPAAVEDLQLAMEHLWWRKRVSNGAILLRKNRKLELHAWKPYGPYCGLEVTKQTYTEYLTGNLKIFHSGFFWNLHDCPVKAVDVPDFNNFINYEEIMFRTILRGMRGTAVIERLPVSMATFAPRQNGTIGGWWAKLINRDMDFLFRGMPTSLDTYELTDVLWPYNVENFAFIAPLPRKVPEWKIIFLVFNWEIWAFSTLTVIAASFVLYHASNIKIGKAFLNAIAITLNVSVPHGESPTLRIFLANFFLCVITLTAAYQSCLYKSMTDGFDLPPAETAMDMAKLGYQFNLPPFSEVPMRMGFSDLYEYLTTHGQVSWSDDLIESLQRVAQQKDITLLPETTITHHAIRFFKTTDNRYYLRLLKEQFSITSTAFFLWKHHPLTPTADLLTKWMLEHGLVQHYTALAKRDSEMYRNETRSRLLHEMVNYYHDHDGKVPIDHLWGCFGACAVGLLVSAVVFILELAIGKVLEGNKRVGRSRRRGLQGLLVRNKLYHHKK